MRHIDYTLWPNPEGPMGQIKVAIPDGVTVQWPDGDVLEGNFIYKDGLLSGFVDTKALVANDSNSTTFPYDYVKIEVDKSLKGVMSFNRGERTKYFTVTYSGSSNSGDSGDSGDTVVFKYINCTTPEEVIAVDPDYLTNDIVDGVWSEGLGDLASGYYMFSKCENLTTFSSDLPSLTFGDYMFNSCSNLTSFSSDLSSLTSGFDMFSSCTNLTSFTSNLSSLTDGRFMFSSCTSLTSFTSNLSSLIEANNMFYKCKLTTFTSDLSALTKGVSMFSNCSNLTTFTSDLSALTNGRYMFNYCSSLTSFTSDLSSLMYSEGMFWGCENLTTFNCDDLNSLTYGHHMFYNCDSLTTFTSDLSSLADGTGMFDSCTSLTSFTSDLSALTNGDNMFHDCSNLESFTSDLMNLTDGSAMFSNCNLDADSIENITSTINTIYNESNLDLGINPSIVLNTNVKNNLDVIKAKGWNVYVNGNEYISEIKKLGTTFINCKTIDDVESISSDYKTEYVINGTWNESLANLEDGNPTVNNWSKGMFYNCGNLSTFYSDLRSLTCGFAMFKDCSNLTAFASDLRSLTNGRGMFYNCENLTTFSSDLKSLTDGICMFEDCSNLTAFASDLRSLTNGESMFEYCSNLTTFTSDLRSLISGINMFNDCTNLTSFNADLSSLTNGNRMFLDCYLDTASVQNIAETIKDVNDLENTLGCCDIWKYIHIGIGNLCPNTEEDAAFRLMAEKGWTVFVNGEDYDNPDYQPDNLASLDENSEAVSAPNPFYAKPVQTDEKHARYTDDEGNYFNILGAQFIYGDDISTYGMFLNEEDAAANMHLTKIEK